MNAPRPKTPTAQRKRDATRKRAVRHARGLMEQGAGRCEAARIAGEKHGAALSSVLRWMDRLDTMADDDTTPLDGRITNRVERASVWGAPGADDAFLAWRSDYLRLEAPGAAACWRRTEKRARARGWTLPSTKTFLRRLRSETRACDIVFARQGLIAALKFFPHQIRTVKALRPLDILNGDGRKHDVFVERDGSVFRPVTWAWQDARTRRILGWESGETESADLLRLAFVQVVDEAGAPRAVYMDNTRAASAKWWSARQNRRWRSDEEFLPGILDLLEVDVMHTGVDRTRFGKGVGRGQSKPVERFFRDIVEGIDKDPRCADAYTGNNPNAKPENYAQHAVPWETWIEVVAEGVAEYNARPKRRMEAAAGRSIDETWAAEIDSTPVRRLTQEQRALLLLACESTQVKEDGTFALKAGRGTGLPANRYFHESLQELHWRRPENRTVIARFDPADLHAGVHVYDTEGRPLCFAECRDPVGFNDKEAARAYERERNRWLRSRKKTHAARGRMEHLRDGGRAEPAASVRPVASNAKPANSKVVEIVRPGRFDQAARDEIDEQFERGLRLMQEGR